MCICTGNDSDHSVGTPTYNERLPSYSPAPNESHDSKCNQDDLELQENVDSVTTAYSNNQKDFELHKNAVYVFIGTTYEDVELQEPAYSNSIVTQNCTVQSQA